MIDETQFAQSSIAPEPGNNAPCRTIVHIYQELDLGGRQIALLALARAQKRAGHDVHLVSFISGQLQSKFIAAGIKVKVLDRCRKYRRPLVLKEYLLAVQAEVVHTHLFSAGLWGRLAAIIAKVPVIVHTEGGLLFESRRWKRVPVERILLKKTNALVCVAQVILDHLHDYGGLPTDKLVVIPNALANRKLLDIPLTKTNDQPVLFSAGRLAPIKGYDLLIRAIALVPDFSGQLVIAGDGPERDRLISLAEQCGVSDKLSMIGYCDDLDKLYAGADFYIAPSRSEGMSNSILEAMAAGVPVIATDVGGNRELLGDNGLIVEPENPKALASAINQSIQNSEASLSCAQAARSHVVAHHSMEVVVAQHDALYERYL